MKISVIVGCIAVLSFYGFLPSASFAAMETRSTISSEIGFQSGKADIGPEHDRSLGEVADFMKAHPNAKAEIQGFTDNVGEESFNRGLSQQRADAVRQALMQRGVDGSRLIAQGFGVANSSSGVSGGNAADRRVMMSATAVERQGE